MESEQTENFNERLSQWVASQGFWFQLRYSMSGKGVGGRTSYHLLRMAAQLLIFLLIAAAGFAVYLVKRPGSSQFYLSVRDGLKSVLSAKELEIRQLQYVQGLLEIAGIAAEGGEETFFESLDARNIRANMNLLDGLVGTWKTGNILISRLDLDLRAGANDAQSAARLAEALFKQPARVVADSFEVSDATLRWGYSERTQGTIEASNLKMQRLETGWRLSFTGGRFSQNWLRQLEIVNLVVVAERAGIIFERAEFRAGTGTVEFPGMRVRGGARPEVDGVVKIRGLELERVIPAALRDFVEGSISGDLKASGSTNTSDGISFEGQVILDGTDRISLRERIHLLKALSVVDYSRNYHRVDFREGSFFIRTGGGGLKVSEIDLRSEDLFTLQGGFSVRLPTRQEIDDALAQGDSPSPIFAGEEVGTGLRPSAGENADLTLRRAALEARRAQEGAPSADSLKLSDRIAQGVELRRLQNQAAERMSRMLRYEGAVVITLPGDVFERAPRLQQIHPADVTTGRVALHVPLQGHIYELTLRQAEDIYQQGQR